MYSDAMRLGEPLVGYFHVQRMSLGCLSMEPSAQRVADPLLQIFAYRALDLRDRFPHPLETFREALECLQSDRSYMPEMSGEIIAYLRGGFALSIPDHFFLHRSSDTNATLVPPEQNDAVCVKVEAWLHSALGTLAKIQPMEVRLEDRPYSLDDIVEKFTHPAT